MSTHSRALGLSSEATSPAQSQTQACPKAPRRLGTDLPHREGAWCGTKAPSGPLTGELC